MDGWFHIIPEPGLGTLWYGFPSVLEFWLPLNTHYPIVRIAWEKIGHVFYVDDYHIDILI